MDPRIGNVHIDANALDRGGAARGGDVDRFLALVEADEISVVIPHSVKGEIAHPKTPDWVKLASNSQIFSLPVNRTPEEMARLEDLRKLLRGNAQSDKHDADAEHLFEASKYGGQFFITHDKRILSKSKAINALVGRIRIVTLEDFLRDYDRAGLQ